MLYSAGRPSSRLAFTLGLVALFGAGPSAQSRNEWLSGKTTADGKTTPMSYEALKSALPAVPGSPPVATGFAPQAAPPGPVLIDLTMSIIDDPAGDNNGNTQGVAGSEAQDKWERIVQHFADGIYEMTEGAQKIRKVRIFRKGKYAKGADIVWTAAGRPAVPGVGIGEQGGYVAMYKSFTDGEGTGKNHDMLADEQGSGYTMAHEWAHYAYGLYDEYKKTTTQVSVPTSVMTSQWNAKGSPPNLKWLNFSIKNRGGGDWQNTSLTDQHATLGVSCWEALARDPSMDPRRGSLGRRVYYPELAAVAPAANADPVVGTLSSASRDQLNIIWADRVLFEIIIDNSGSMSGSPMENAKAAAKLLVDRAPLMDARIGVIQFNSTATEVHAISNVDTEADKTTIKNTIDAIFAGGNTAIGDAAQLGLNKVVAAQTAGDTSVVFLLSDGVSNTGVAPLSVVPAYQAAQIPLFTFAFGSGADASTLQSMAQQTGGKFYASGTSLGAISVAFQDAFSAAVLEPTLTDSVFTVPKGREALSRFPVDSGLNQLQLAMIIPTSGVTVALVPPTGPRIAPDSVVSNGFESVAQFTVDAPKVGTWAVAAKNTAGGARTVSYQLGGEHKSDSFNVTAYSVEGTAIAFPRPVLVRAKVSGVRAIKGAVLTANATGPDGIVIPLTLADNGKHPDDLAGDGIYSAYFYYTQNGSYNFFVQADNRRKSAKFTSKGAVQCDFTIRQGDPADCQCADCAKAVLVKNTASSKKSTAQKKSRGASSAGVSGDAVASEPDKPVKENFVRTSRFSIVTTGGVFARLARQLPTGTFTTLISPLAADHEHSGAIKITVTAGGGFTGTFSYGGALSIGWAAGSMPMAATRRISPGPARSRCVSASRSMP